MIKNNERIYILDTSSILSGKNVNLIDCKLITTPGVSNEINPGRKDYEKFELLKETGLKIFSPNPLFIKKIKNEAKKTGDIGRLSNTDIEILALALEIKSKKEKPIILTDDYSIQNIADTLSINYENILQSKIKKRFKWISKCLGCGKKYKENINTCPICGSKTKKSIAEKRDKKLK
jgi:UPF0271 protein